MAVEESIFQKPIDLANFGIIIGGSESHQSATDFPTDPGGGKTKKCPLYILPQKKTPKIFTGANMIDQCQILNRTHPFLQMHNKTLLQNHKSGKTAFKW